MNKVCWKADLVHFGANNYVLRFYVVTANVESPDLSSWMDM
jgi:hypothetical protein